MRRAKKVTTRVGASRLIITRVEYLTRRALAGFGLRKALARLQKSTGKHIIAGGSPWERIVEFYRKLHLAGKWFGTVSLRFCRATDTFTEQFETSTLCMRPFKGENCLNRDFILTESVGINNAKI